MNAPSDASPEGSDSRGRDRRSVFLWAVGSVVVLALVIFGISALSSPKDEPEPSGTTAPRSADDLAKERSERLYQQALKAQQSGDTTGAIDLTEQALKAYAENDDAKVLLATLVSSTASSGGSSGGSGSGGSGGGTTTSSKTPTSTTPPAQGRVAKIETLLPSKIRGYTIGLPVKEQKVAVVSADPYADSDDALIVTHVLFSVHDRGTEAAARKWVETVNKKLYGEDRKAVTILGGPGYMGTDGARLASAAFWRGPYAFEVVATTITEELGDAGNIALKSAAAFPVKR